MTDQDRISTAKPKKTLELNTTRECLWSRLSWLGQLERLRAVGKL